MSCPTEIVQLMHKHLDHEIEPDEEKRLREHLQGCEECHKHFYELEKAIALVQSTSHVEAPKDFTLAIMDKLPNEKRTVSWNRWLRGHPFVAAASLFIILMAGSLVSAWNTDQQFSVSKQPNLVVENSKVTVPKGEVIKGDVTIKNGSINIEGKVDGDVTVINGERYMASAGQVTGEIEEVDEIFEWLWYHIKSMTNDVVGIFN
ncbi:anti-sigma-W factor RsiW [Metabacillus herbersteinensis]|uniref:Anti-sigma-W factor RsiW n=1 Tax=Metabacillus herbersteinensis TaxID=283816 RepID=A0ABV6GM69_9BACI